MRKVTNCLSGAALSLMLVSSAAFGQATIEIGSGDAIDGMVSIDTVLITDGNDIAGTENVVLFPPEAQPFKAGENEFTGAPIPSCAFNAALGREASAFSFTPDGCFDDDAVACESMKALVLSFSNLSPIPDGSTLFTCDLNTSGAAGDYTVGCDAPGASDPAGNAVDAVCADGTVTIPDVPVAEIDIGDAEGVQGGTASVDITLNLLEDGTEVAGTENVVSFPAEAQPFTAGVDEFTGNPIPSCAFNPALGREASAFSFLPADCFDDPAVDCDTMKALVLSFSNLSAIPDGSVLYTCDLALAGGTSAATLSGVSGEFTVGCSDAGGSSPEGDALTTLCSDGTVTIVAPPPPTPTFTVTPTESDATPTDTPDLATPTEVPPTATNTPAPQPDDDSCAIVAPQSSSTGWMLLMPMAALLWLRRRNR